MPITAAAPLIGAGVSILGASKAASASNKASAQALALQQQQYQQARTDMQPYMQAGQGALNALQQRIVGGAGAGGADPGSFGATANPAYSQAAYQAPDAFSYSADDYTQSPGYQWQLQQGLGAINSSQAHRGALNSGATLKSLASYAQGLAAQDFNAQRDYAAGRYDTDRDFSRNVYDTDANRARANYESDRGYLTGRYDTQTQNLNGLAGMGQSAASGLVNAGTDMANASSQVLNNRGNTQSGVWNGAAGNAIKAGQGATSIAAAIWPGKFPGIK